MCEVDAWPGWRRSCRRKPSLHERRDVARVVDVRVSEEHGVGADARPARQVAGCARLASSRRPWNRPQSHEQSALGLDEVHRAGDLWAPPRNRICMGLLASRLSIGGRFPAGKVLPAAPAVSTFAARFWLARAPGSVYDGLHAAVQRWTCDP